MLLDLVMEIIVTGVVEGAQCRRVPWPVRIVLLVLIVAFFGGVGVLLLLCAFGMRDVSVWMRLVCLVGSGMCLFYVGNSLRKAIRK